MEAPPGRVHLLYGDNEFAVREEIRQLREELGDPGVADLNTSAFRGRDLDWAALEEACLSAPFLGPRRLVIVWDADRLPRDGAKERLLGLFDRLPPSTSLILIELFDFGSVRPERGESPDAAQDRLYRRKSWLGSHAARLPERIRLRKFAIPRGAGFVSWLRDRCRQMGGEIEVPAARRLAEWTEEDPFLAEQELSKLVDYVRGQRAIHARDVEALTPARHEGDVFGLVDALARREGSVALQHLHRLLAEGDPLPILGMIVRQFRLLLVAHQAAAEGLAAGEALRPFRVPDFVVRKLSAQAAKFQKDDLDRAYHQLLEIDVASKSGKDDLASALYRMVGEWGR